MYTFTPYKMLSPGQPGTLDLYNPGWRTLTVLKWLRNIWKFLGWLLAVT